MLLKSLEVVKFFRGFLTNKLNSFFMKWRWKITRDLRNDYITRQLWVQILFANFPDFKNNVLFIMTDFVMRIIFGHIWVFWQIRKVLADKENWRWRPESPFFSLCCNVFQWVKSASCVRMEWIPETWKLKGTTKVQKCICDEIRLNNIDILLLVFVVIVTFRVCEWKREKRKKVEKFFADILLPRDLAGGRFATIVI